jgi:hypothetical protein
MCERFPIETYRLYALGLAGEAERAQIQSHLRSHCEHCLRQIRESCQFWYLFGMLTEELQGFTVKGPRAILRRRILGSIHTSRLRLSIVPAWRWMRAAAASVIVCGVGVATWSINQAFARLEKQRLAASVAASSAEVSRLIGENRSLQSEIESVRRRSVVARDLRQPANGKELDKNTLEILNNDLRDARQSAASNSEALAQARVREETLRQQLSSTSASLASAVKEREEANAKYRSAVDQATQQTSSAAADKAHIRQMEALIVEYRHAIEEQRRTLNEHLRIASLLRSPSVALVKLRATEAGGGASGNVLVEAQSVIMFYASNLPALPAGRTYQLWLIRGRKPAIVSAGTFNTATPEISILQFRNAEVISDIKAIAVTEEPTGGSSLPTGHKMLIGTVGS